MRFLERKQKLEYLLEMIEKGRCISIQQIAVTFNCSKRTATRMISELKEDGNDIYYCRKKQIYIIKPKIVNRIKISNDRH